MNETNRTRVGPYEIKAPLGAGGMGEVYRAWDPRLAREVAVKVLPSEVAEDPGRRRRFLEEARAAGRLNHPNILAVYDVSVGEGTPFIVSELLDGRQLRDEIDRGPVAMRKLLDFAAQIASGLRAAHEAGLAHRDLKPENVMILPRAGRKTPARRTYERQRWFRRGQRWRVGCEGRISVIKRRHGLRRCRYHGAEGTARWVGLGVIANNLVSTATVLNARPL
jgi:hypothetical protein